jgi:hypothetical protein
VPVGFHWGSKSAEFFGGTAPADYSERVIPPGLILGEWLSNGVVGRARDGWRVLAVYGSIEGPAASSQISRAMRASGLRT